ncbi:hypothetical protein [Sunxiuqinia rutila]|uniref:hypothetical protein n=1 Tax=Sunxiuqinia rutila TaxID=1397841 RepID=UPI003D36114D
MIVVVLALLLMSCGGVKHVVHVSGTANNDLINILKTHKNIQLTFHDSPEQAIQKAQTGDALLVLSSHYPNKPEELGDNFYDLLKEKGVRAYLEFPSSLPDRAIGGIEQSNKERVVVNSTFFNGYPDSLAILGLNGLHYLNVDPKRSKVHMVAAKVAGFDLAIFGLPEKQYPLLLEMNDWPILLSTTNLSGFVSGRYAPSKEWGAVWQNILEFVMPGIELEDLSWEPVVGATYAKEEPMPADYEKESFSRGVEWYKNARMLIPASYKDTLRKMVDSGIERLAWSEDIPAGEGSSGVFECIFSEIDENGNQPIGIMERGDCISETAMAFATAGKALENDEYLQIARNLLDYYLLNSIATKNEYADPDHGAYGLIPWGISNYVWYKASYGDDNARFFLGAWTTAALTGSDHWDEILMKSLLALARTTGQNGFRGSRIDLPHFEKNGWRHYFDQEIVHLAPHFESYLWACYLWAYDKTGDDIFLKRAKNGIQIMMEHYPDGWTWTNGLAQERARMILPLAWLVRVENTDANRAMLLTVVNDFLELQDECGAIQEELGAIEMGNYPPPQSNEAYGTNEASLIAQNGDPVSDLLYTTNFAFLGLHEACYATDDAEVKKATDKLAEFLCRIQVKSNNLPELDGGWMRAFDYQRFEQCGSNADLGWGAWAIETGWTQGWITAILALRDMDVSIWDLTKNSEIARHHAKLKKEMIPVE